MTVGNTSIYTTVSCYLPACEFDESVFSSFAAKLKTISATPSSELRRNIAVDGENSRHLLLLLPVMMMMTNSSADVSSK